MRPNPSTASTCEGAERICMTINIIICSESRFNHAIFLTFIDNRNNPLIATFFRGLHDVRQSRYILTHIRGYLVHDFWVIQVQPAPLELVWGVLERGHGAESANRLCKNAAARLVDLVHARAQFAVVPLHVEQGQVEGVAKLRTFYFGTEF